MSIELNVTFEKGIYFLTEHIPASDETSRKPILFHDLRVGVYLYEHGYSQYIVLAGLLHDTLEWSSASEEMMRKEFGDEVVRLVKANTKNDSITDKYEKTKELIERCVRNGEEALIIKAADILDSFKWYTSQNNIDELKYCTRNANAIFQYKPQEFKDRIFEELKEWQIKYSGLEV